MKQTIKPILANPSFCLWLWGEAVREWRSDTLRPAPGWIANYWCEYTGLDGPDEAATGKHAWPYRATYWRDPSQKP